MRGVCSSIATSAAPRWPARERCQNRGFWPVATYSAHYFRDPRLRRPIESYLKMEDPYVEASLKAARERCPLRAPPDGPPGEPTAKKGVKGKKLQGISKLRS